MFWKKSMTPVRQGEIALALWLHGAVCEGVKLSLSNHEERVYAASVTHIPLRDLEEFDREIMAQIGAGLVLYPLTPA